MGRVRGVVEGRGLDLDLLGRLEEFVLVVDEFPLEEFADDEHGGVVVDREGGAFGEEEEGDAQVVAGE